MPHALALDGGGSKCDAVVLDETGRVVGWGRGGSTHCYYVSPETVRQSYRDALEQALGDLHSEGFWVSATVPPAVLTELLADHGPVLGQTPAGEVESGLASAQKTWGMVILSGTGSFAHGRLPDGRSRHFGSMGPLLGDYGSAYAVGLYGLRAAFASRWTEARRTSLEQAIPPVYGLSNLKELFDLIYGPGLSRREIALSARVVNDQAEAGDRVALAVLQGAADELAMLALDVINELQMHGLAFPLIANGSVAQKSRLWWQRLCERVLTAAPHAQPIVPHIRPVIGGALLALKAMGVAWTPELLATIEQTQEPHLQRIETNT
jgi:N-acetylglucosamine kinase